MGAATSCADPESFVRGGQNWTFFFRGDRIQTNITISSWPSLTHQLNAIKLRFAEVPMMARH